MRVNLGAAFDVRVAQLSYAPDGTLFAAVASDHVVVALARDAAPRWMRVNAPCVVNVTGVCATPRLLVVAVMHSSATGGLVVMDRRRGVVIRSTKRVANGRLRTVGHVCATRVRRDRGGVAHQRVCVYGDRWPRVRARGGPGRHRVAALVCVFGRGRAPRGGF